MHELGMCEGIAEAVLRRADGRRVTSARVRVGGHAVDPDVIDQGFRLAAAGTLAEDAAIDLVMEPMSLRCHRCGNEQPVRDHLSMVACPQCAAVDIELIGNDRVVLESITVASAEPEREQQEVS
jgi:hydrogenase nickel incorporation protein HypA/HybF